MATRHVTRIACAGALLALAGCATTYESDYYGRTDRYGDYWVDERDTGYADERYVGYSPYHSVLWPSYTRYADPWYSPSYTWSVGFWSQPRWYGRSRWDYGWSYAYDPWGWRYRWSPWRDPWYYDRWSHGGWYGYSHGYRRGRDGGNTDWRHGYRDRWSRDRSAREEAERQAWRDGTGRYDPRARDEGYGRYDESVGRNSRGFGVPADGRGADAPAYPGERGGGARGELDRYGDAARQPDTTVPLGRQSGYVGALPERGGQRQAWREVEPREDDAPARNEPGVQRYGGAIERRDSSRRWESERTRFDSGYRREAPREPAFDRGGDGRYSDNARAAAEPSVHTLPSDGGGWRSERHGQDYAPERSAPREEIGGRGYRFERSDDGGSSRGFDRGNDGGSRSFDRGDDGGSRSFDRGDDGGGRGFDRSPDPGGEPGFGRGGDGGSARSEVERIERPEDAQQ